MAPRPTLHPLVTPKTMLFPSELHDKPSPTIKLEDDSDCGSSGCRAAITPPPAYTDFLDSLTPVFSPATSTTSEFPYPPSNMEKPCPSLTTKTSFPTSYKGRRPVPRPLPLAPTPPASAPAPLRSAPPASHIRGSGAVQYPNRRLPPPSASSCLRSPSTEYLSPSSYSYYTHSPRSAVSNTSSSSSIRSPYAALGSSRSAGSGVAKPSLNLRHVVTRTVRVRQMQTPTLQPPPRGKRRVAKEK